ncbi:MAG: TonB-dependent receptor [Campylobacterota bacterium]|nr:TonB-dependent receptor [Campylobacterota bacterium]
MTRVLLLLLLGSLTSLSSSDFDFEQDFLQSLEEVSEIATKTKLNIDDMPAFATILQRERLLQLGVDNIFEALGFVPGVQLSREGTGVPVVIFRGATQKGEVKLMVDGVTINNAYRGSIYYYLDFPVELVERIEVIRGPGSVLYGSNAISGVINIITRNASDGEKSSLFVSGGSDSAYKGGAIVSLKEDDFHLSADTYYQKNDKQVDGGPDRGGSYGSSDHSLRDYSVGIHTSIGGFSFNGRIKHETLGTGYGFGNFYEPSNDLKGNENGSLFAEFAYKLDVSSDISLKTVVGFNEYEQEVEVRHLPGYMSDIVTSGANTTDLILGNDYKEQTCYAEAYAHTTQIDHHDIIVGARYEKTKTEKTDFFNYFEYTSDTYIPATDIIKPDSERYIVSLYANDQFSMSEKFDISAGIRWDHYDDFGDAYSPRLGLVYRATEKLNLKMMASRAFRAPSWIELYSSAVSLGDSALKEERADTLEVGAVYKEDMKSILRLNAYITRINDMIVKEGSQYTQQGNNDFSGVEVEYEHALNNEMQLSLLGSYVHGEDDDGNSLPNIANYLANASLLYELGHGISSGSVLRYVSSSEREAGDDRSDLDSYITFDQTFTYRLKAFTALATVKNLFDDRVAYAAPVGTYQNDYPEVGRTFWLKASWEF